MEFLEKLMRRKQPTYQWRNIEDLYTKKSSAKRLCIKKTFYTLEIQKDDSISKHINAFNKIIIDLKDLMLRLLMKRRLLSSLLESYEHFVDILLYGRQELLINDVKKVLSSREITKNID